MPSFTISEWCRDNRLSRAWWYKTPAELKPDVMRVNGIVRITPEADARWRAEREAATKAAEAANHAATAEAATQ